MNNNQFERLVHNLQDIMRCPHCSAKYQMSDIQYLGKMDEMTFLHMKCADCNTPVFASVALANDQGELKSTDISTSEMLFNSKEEKQDPTPSEVRFTPKEQPMTNIPVEDISADRVFASLNRVSHDDVLDTHLYLNDFTGDFEGLFRA